MSLSSTINCGISLWDAKVWIFASTNDIVFCTTGQIEFFMCLHLLIQKFDINRMSLAKCPSLAKLFILRITRPSWLCSSAINPSEIVVIWNHATSIHHHTNWVSIRLKDLDIRAEECYHTEIIYLKIQVTPVNYGIGGNKLWSYLLLTSY